VIAAIPPSLGRFSLADPSRSVVALRATAADRLFNMLEWNMMRHVAKFACALALGGGSMALVTFAQGPPPPPPPSGQPGAAFPNLSPAELARWNVGKNLFLQPVSVPNGLGPVFNEASCAQCHGGAQAPGASGPELVTHFGRYFGNTFDPMTAFGGPVIQAKGIGKFNGVNFVGEVVPPQATVVARRRTQALFGLGLVDAVPDAVFIALAEHEHATSPLTAGGVSMVVDPSTGMERVGRFGWKAQEPTLFAFAADALVNEMGVTTPVFPQENCPQGNCQLLAADPAKTEPNAVNDVPIQQLADFLTFTAPPPPGPRNATTQAGQALFTALGCAQCHTPVLETGPSPSAALNQVAFAPYSDFLLHDMGALGDGIVQGSATGHLMRTAPLWGLRFEKQFLHDGRATTVDEAILEHDGQGLSAGTGYARLTPAQKAQLLAFLGSL
jgi:CxxC motif-containing protein (DUF1111 family)